MTATNHVLTGAVIGAVVHQPTLALPLAFVSHFICDGIPHFGDKKHFDLPSRNFAIMLVIDSILAAIILLTIVLKQPQNWVLITFCGIAAASPDLGSIPRYIREVKHIAQPKKFNPFLRFHIAIQWAETPIGAIIELCWFIAFGNLLITITK